MAVYTVTLRADKAKYPVLLSNGNLVEQGEPGQTAATSPSWARPASQAQLPVRPGGRPAGGARAAHHARRAGKDHLLQVYVRRGDLDKTEHAMNSPDGLRSSGTRRASACRWTWSAS